MSKGLERLTYDKNGTTPKIYDCDFLDNSKCIQKLGQLEDIEQELGIDLLTLLKALKGLIYKPTYEKMIKYCGGKYPRYAEGFGLRYNEPTNRYFLSVGSPIDDVWQVLELKDYGKTWALTREELEK